MRGALASLGDTAPLRSVLARGLLKSHAETLPERFEIEPELWIPEMFRRFLGRRAAEIA